MADTLMVTTLRWTIDNLLSVRSNAVAVAPGIDETVVPQFDVMSALRDIAPLAFAEGVRPTRTDIDALRREGYPWNVVAPVADELRRTEESLSELARKLVMPDPELKGRLFHLAVLGTVLLGLAKLGATITSIRPLSAASAGPAYIVRHNRFEWHLWFEAGGIWSFYGASSPYMEATIELPGGQRPLSPDILLLRREQPAQAVIVECKYSDNPDYIGRDGMSQALAYSVEVRSRLADSVSAFVVPPDGVGRKGTAVKTAVGTVGIVGPADLLEILRQLLGENQT